MKSGGTSSKKSARFTLFACRARLVLPPVYCWPQVPASATACPKCLPIKGVVVALSGVAALDAGGCDEIVVVLGAAIVDVPAPARAVVAEDWAEGLPALP